MRGALTRARAALDGPRASCCASSAAAGRSPRTRTPRRPRGACSRRPRTPTLTPAQAETLSIVAYLQPVSRPEIARIRGVASESATARARRARPDRGGRPLAVRRRALPHHAAVPEAVRPALARGAPRRSRSGTRARGAGRAARPPAARGRGAHRRRGRLTPWPCAASWPQAASMSRPRVRRTVARMPCSSSAALNAAIALARRALVDRVGRVVRDQVDLEDPRVEQLGELDPPARSCR